MLVNGTQTQGIVSPLVQDQQVVMGSLNEEMGDMHRFIRGKPRLIQRLCAARGKESQ